MSLAAYARVILSGADRTTRKEILLTSSSGRRPFSHLLLLHQPHAAFRHRALAESIARLSGKIAHGYTRDFPLKIDSLDLFWSQQLAGRGEFGHVGFLGGS